MAPEPTDMNAIFASLQGDRMIEIHIASETTPINIPQTTLERTSDYFKGALKPNFLEGREGKIYLREDDLTAWKVLVPWMLRRELPLTECTQEDLIKAWYLGDKYQINQFQDDVMAEMLYEAIVELY